MTKRLAWPGGVLSLVLLSIACDVKVGEQGLSFDIGGGKVTEEWDRTYTLKPGGRLEIVNLNGAIHASGSTDAEVQVHAVREVRASTDQAAQDLLKRFEIREEVAADRVLIHVAEGEGGRGQARSRVTIRYEVRIPPGLDVLLRTQNGDVRMEGLQGTVTASATNGTLTGRQLSGRVDASTVNGGVDVSLESIAGDSRFSAVNGGVRMNVGPGVNAELDATVVNGGVRISDDVTFAADQRTPQRVDGRIGSGGPRIVVHVTNGGITIGSREGRVTTRRDRQ
ncbi:MAG TPA: DUF4097 family beta strand repeat-containing protein [Vicinamibacterales bacterium]|nr:DUF4097 family beta strand repeat-containing protein [Vicinamibacterales bacterium]